MQRPSPHLFIAAVLCLVAVACGGGGGLESVTDDGSDETTTTIVGDEDSADDGDAGATTTTAPATTAPAETTTTTEPGPVTPPVPEPMFDAVAAPADAGVACVGTRVGLSCLNDGEWVSFDGDNAPIYDWVQVIDICDDGRVVVPSVNGISVYDGSSWGEIAVDFANGSANAVACRGDAIWAGYFGSIGVFQGGAWTSWETEPTLGTTEFVTGVDDIAVAPDGSAWAVTGSSVARFADGAWTYWEEGNGFDGRFSPDAITVDEAADGTYIVYVAAGSTGIARFAGENWETADQSLNGNDAIAARGGDIFIPAFKVGLDRFNQGVASEIGVDAGLSSSTVRDVAIDSAGNVWAATAYGLTILGADDARTYRVDNSGLIDNRAYSVVVQDGGPALPADAPKEWASLAGVVLEPTGSPLAGITVEVCVEDLRDEFEGDSPCALDPYAASGETDDTGRFEIVGLRAGSYVVSMNPEKGWTYFTDGPVSARYEAVAGELSELGVFEISSAADEAAEEDDGA